MTEVDNTVRSTCNSDRKNSPDLPHVDGTVSVFIYISRYEEHNEGDVNDKYASLDKRICIGKYCRHCIQI